MKRRGFTMIELVITISLTAMIVGVVASLYSFVSIRLCDSYTQSNVTEQVNDVADRIEATIRNADSCVTKDGGATLVCGMPVNGVDSDGDGHADTYYPDQVDANNEAVYTVGRYYWFFESDSSGESRGQASGLIWRADSSGNSRPTISENDATFMYFPGPGSRLRNPLVYSAVFSVDTSTKTVTFTLTGGSRIGSENTDTSEVAASRIVRVSRTVRWRN